VVQREVQSVEVSCFIQATEDEARVIGSVMKHLEIAQEPELEPLEGHFGNRILHARWHLTGEEAWKSARALAAFLGSDGRGELKKNLRSYLDEHGALYLRLNKQTLVSGAGVVADADPVRVKVKPRGFLLKGPPEMFYERLMELDGT
jgi:RNA binding exosome subunit